MKYDVKISTCVEDFMNAGTTTTPIIEIYDVPEDAFAHFIELAKMGVIALAFDADCSSEA